MEVKVSEVGGQGHEPHDDSGVGVATAKKGLIKENLLSLTDEDTNVATASDVTRRHGKYGMKEVFQVMERRGENVMRRFPCHGDMESR